MALVTKKEKHFMFNSLVCLAQSLEGRYTIVDLRNESCVTGKIDQVDAYMNIVMSEAVFIDTRGNEYEFHLFFIHARSIRYVHIPVEIQIVPAIKNQLKKMSRKPRSREENPKMTWKGKKLLKRQEETLKEVRRLKEEKEMQRSKSHDSKNTP